jgi:HD superfamily phosphohydrolase YqeK
MDPNDLIDTIVDAIDYAEVAQDLQGLIKARRLLNNDLRQAIDVYVQDEVARVLDKNTSAQEQIQLAN